MHGTTATSGRRVRRGRSAVLALFDAGTLGVGLLALAVGVTSAFVTALGFAAGAPERAAEIAAAAAWVLWGGRPPARSAPLPGATPLPRPQSLAGRIRWALSVRLGGGSLLAFACVLVLSHGLVGGLNVLTLLDIAALGLGTAFGCAVAVEAARESARLASSSQGTLAHGEQRFAPALEREAFEHTLARPLTS